MRNKVNFPFNFSPVSAQEWKMALQAGLKGGDYNALLTSTLPEGIHIKPFYTCDDLPNSVSQTHGIGTAWEIGTVIEGNGRNSEFQSPEDWKDGINTWITELPVSQSVWPDWMKTRTAWPEKVLLIPANPYDFCFDPCPEPIKGKTEVLIDPIGHFTKTGNWVRNQTTDLQFLQNVAKRIRSSGLVPRLLISGQNYQQAGANAVQEIAYMLAHAREYLLHTSGDNTTKFGFEPPVFRVAIGGEYFSDIAKIRALRQGWALLAKAEQFPIACKIWSHPSLRNKTAYDYNTNLLRTTLECMAGIFGGADIISNITYDAVFGTTNAFSDRLARNQLLVLRHEAHLDKVSNPADGAYFIEHLTNQFGKKGLELLKNIEKGGGLIAQFKSHTIQKKVRQSATSEQSAFEANQRILVGSNLYPNPQDRMTGLAQSSKSKKAPKKTEIEPLMLRRLARPYEKKRSENETN